MSNQLAMLGMRRATFLLLVAHLVAARLDECYSVGDTHVRGFEGTQSRRHFDVMGEEEWIISDGPDDYGVPKYRVQGIQKAWQNCGNSNQHITVLKHIAYQCGDFHMLVDSNKLVSQCYQYTAAPVNFKYDNVYNPAFYIKGVNANTKREYTGQDYLKDADFSPGKTMTFLDGSGPVETPSTGSIRILNHNCYHSDCTGRHNDQKLRLELRCKGTVSEFRFENGGNGASFVNLWLKVPSNNNNEPIRVGDENHRNLLGGYCGGWSTKDNIWRTLDDLNNKCAPSKYHDANCNKQFITTPQNSLFASWEHWTGGKFDSKKVNQESAAEVAKSITPFNQEKYDQYKKKCLAFANKAFPNVKYSDKPANGREFLVESMVDDCAEDCYFGLIWSQQEFDDTLCENVGIRIEQERKDIYCAATLLKAEGKKTNPRELLASTLKKAKSTADVDALINLTNDVATLAEEVASSTDNIEYWKSDLCTLRIEATEDIAETDCSVWEFRDSQSAEDSAAFKRSKSHLLSNHIAFDVHPTPIDVAKNFLSPVLFVGPLSLTDTRVASVRASFAKGQEKNQFSVFVREPKCLSFDHAKETAGYVVLDTTHEYDGLEVFTEDIKGREWQTITWEQDLGGAPLVFATVQSTNNNACPACRTRPEGVAGYVNVRIRSCSGKSCEVRLETDTDSIANNVGLEPERVAFIATNKESGDIGEVSYRTGSLDASESSGHTNGDRPVTVQSVSIPGFEAEPIVLTSVMSARDDLPATTRKLEFVNAGNVYKFVLDRDVCSPAQGTARSHKGEKVAWIAFEKL